MVSYVQDKPSPHRQMLTRSTYSCDCTTLPSGANCPGSLSTDRHLHS